eukprot:CAMPEP_0173126228 /NCGR_PEP_ID=MMETSP1102-20130122/56958_1 /TAXON_ID=49646 /ORGANISM="Geminigera sp., Strain Caron Lab Isolate" /LENGTH=272 /DNA_ID=CAMNT_0014035389 /DNA_START=204 /DNA_END=1022 /DNA_ORIENTATION=+
MAGQQKTTTGLDVTVADDDPGLSTKKVQHEKDLLQWHSYVSSCNFTPQTMKKPDVADDKDFSELSTILLTEAEDVKVESEKASRQKIEKHKQEGRQLLEDVLAEEGSWGDAQTGQGAFAGSNPAVPLPKKGLNVSWSKDVYSKHESMRDGPGSRTFVSILPCTLDDFSINLHSNYKQAVADVAGVGIDKVTIVSVKATERCTSGIEIDTAVEDIPASMTRDLTAKNLNETLKARWSQFGALITPPKGSNIPLASCDAGKRHTVLYASDSCTP